MISGLSLLNRDGSAVGKWNALLLGLAYASAEDYRRAVPMIQQSLQLAGGMDHHLTPVGLLTLAQIKFAEGDMKRREHWRWKPVIPLRFAGNTTWSKSRCRWER